MTDTQKQPEQPTDEQKPGDQKPEGTTGEQGIDSKEKDSPRSGPVQTGGERGSKSTR